MLDLKLAERPSGFAVQFDQSIFPEAMGCVLRLPQGQFWSYETMYWRQQKAIDAGIALASWLDTGRWPEHPAGPFTEPDQVLKFWMGGTTVTCPFGEMVQWLEKIMTAQYLVDFHWGAEGPCGSMNWFPESADIGVLEINWSRWPCRYLVRTERRNLVASFYGSFRALVESEHYDPTAYESMTAARTLGYWITDFNADDLIDAIVSMDRRNVARVGYAVGEIFDVSTTPWRGRRPLSLAEFLHQASQLPYYTRTPLKKRGWSSVPEQMSLASELERYRAMSFRELRKRFTHWVPPTWRDLDDSARRAWAMQSFFCGWHRHFGDGDDLLAIRSEKIEAWLREERA